MRKVALLKLKLLLQQRFFLFFFFTAAFLIGVKKKVDKHVTTHNMLIH